MAYWRFRVCLIIFPTWLKGLVIPLESWLIPLGGWLSFQGRPRCEILLGDRQTGGEMEERFCSKMPVRRAAIGQNR